MVSCHFKWFPPFSPLQLASNCWRALVAGLLVESNQTN